ncbi:type II secretion system F family protein [Candidatus Neptunichlamydia sp. REUL1]|uniref:type II secretion system F family protein n=1 Tax=Candidatus Neptunichlamydia sp. REUL1 TaxID=3064277 RepID=UPI00292CBC8F|nr:type II secretion system F family protein [Candidatus Neptunochlamydia sp. REUL1]
MALYQYTALSGEGRRKMGMINADSIELAKERLRKQQILVTKLVSYTKKGDQLTLSSALLVGFTRDLHVLLRAGLPLYDSLLTLEEKYRRTKLHPIFLDLCDQVKEGRLFSEALKDYPKIFDPVYLSLIRAGEESGSLQQSFAELEKLIGREQALKKKLSSAMIYPAFLGVFCLTVISVLLFFLIPSMSELFEERQLHPMTEAVLALSHFLNAHSFLLFMTGAGTLLFFLFFLRHPRGQEKVKRAMLHVPIVKRLFTETIIARFCRVFSILFNGGVSMIECLRLAKKVMKHPSFEAIVTEAEKKVLEGRRLSEEFQKSPLIPTLVVRMLSISEESGRVAEMMNHLSDIYEEDIERSLTRLTSFVQPVMLLFLGVVVAVILLAVLLPLTDVSSILQ